MGGDSWLIHSADICGRLAAAGVSPMPGVARAQQGYPAGLTIKFIVGYPGRRRQDVVGRIVADRLGALWKVPTIVENVRGCWRPTSAWTASPRARRTARRSCIIPPDIATNQFLYSRHGLRSGEGHRSAWLWSRAVPNLLCVRKDLPVNSVAELIAYAKANPGKLNYASSGIGTTMHLSAELFKRMAGVEMGDVPIAAARRRSTIWSARSVDLMFDNITSIIDQARAGAVKPLGIT